MELLRGAALVAATMMTIGLVAGVFRLYAHTIMPGLGRTNGRTFVGAFQSIDKAIINPWFLARFFGALMLTGLAAAFHLGADGRSALPWVATAFVLYLTWTSARRDKPPVSDVCFKDPDGNSWALQQLSNQAERQPQRCHPVVATRVPVMRS